MDTTTNHFFSLTQLSEYKNTVIFKENSTNVLFEHIKREPKHGQRIVAFDLDHTFMNTMISLETVDIIKKLQAERCLVIGITAKRKSLSETTIKEFLALGLNFNQGFFKDVLRIYKGYPIHHLLTHGFLFVDDGSGSSNKKNALRILIGDFQLNLDDVYFIDRNFLSPIQEIDTHTKKKKTCLFSNRHILQPKDLINTQNTFQGVQEKIEKCKKRSTS